MLTAEDVWPHWDTMIATSYKVLGDREAAKECAAEAVAQALEGEHWNVRNVEAFLVTISKRRAIDRFREVAAQRRRDERLAGQLRVADEADVAEAVASRSAARWADQQAKKLLTPRAYELLRLVAEGMPMRDAAARLEMTTDSANDLLYRSRVTMRKALAKALAVLGIGVASLRRSAAPASAAAVSAAALIVWVLLPSDGTAQRVVNPPGEASDVRVSGGGTPPPVRVAQSGGAQATSRDARLRESASAPEREPFPETRVQSPVGGVRVYERDDGYEADGPIDLVLHCLNNVRVEPRYLGCEQAS